MYTIVHELQKRYLGSFPLLKEDLCCEKLLNFKEEYYSLLTLVSEMKPLSIFTEEKSKNGEEDKTQLTDFEEKNYEFMLKIRVS